MVRCIRPILEVLSRDALLTVDCLAAPLHRSFQSDYHPGFLAHDLLRLMLIHFALNGFLSQGN